MTHAGPMATGAPTAIRAPGGRVICDPGTAQYLTRAVCAPLPMQVLLCLWLKRTLATPRHGDRQGRPVARCPGALTAGRETAVSSLRQHDSAKTALMVCECVKSVCPPGRQAACSLAPAAPVMAMQLSHLFAQGRDAFGWCPVPPHELTAKHIQQPSPPPKRPAQFALGAMRRDGALM